MTAIYGMKGENGRRLSRPLLSAAVGLAWGWRGTPELVFSPRGKPGFARAGHWLSLSHSGGYALCALSDEGAVGVDIEVVRPHREGLAEYAMTPAELREHDGTWEDFCRVWTLKEAWSKREDTPLFPPGAVETPPPCPWRSYAGADWWAAVCCRGTPPADILWLAPGKG